MAGGLAGRSGVSSTRAGGGRLQTGCREKRGSDVLLKKHRGPLKRRPRQG
nr:MAG TPA: hypothetical protein [Caudoviricetes sp.]